jgi:hypothetical protein
MALRNWLRSRRSNPTTSQPARPPRLGVQQLEAREVPALTLVSAVAAGNEVNDQPTHTRDLAVDAAGNSYQTGFFNGPVDFDPGRTHPGNADILTARGETDSFVVKYAPDGSFVWAMRMGGDDDGHLDRGFSITVDTSGGVVVTGIMAGTGDFGPVSLTSAGSRDGFVVRLDAGTGTVQWARRWGTGLSEWGNGVGTDAAGNVYVLGLRQLYSSGSFFAYDVQKFSRTGAHTWTKSVTSSLPDTSSSGITADLTVDAAGNVFAVGQFKNSVDFNPGSGRKDTYTVTNPGTEGGSFVLKLTTNGAFSWVTPFLSRQQGSAYGSLVTSTVSVDGQGNVLVGGEYDGLVDFNPGSGVTSLADPSGGYAAKLSSTGGLVWVRGFAKTVHDQHIATVSRLATDASGGVYLTGSFTGGIDLNPGAGTDARLSVLSSDGLRHSLDVFVVKLDAGGEYVWAETFGDHGTDSGTAIGVDASGVVHLAGNFWSVAMDVDPDPLGTYLVTSPTLNQATFLLRLRQD